MDDYLLAPRAIDDVAPRSGMALRDWFAGQVLAGSIRANHRLEFKPDEDAEWSYRVADAMIAERVKERR